MDEPEAGLDSAATGPEPSATGAPAAPDVEPPAPARPSRRPLIAVVAGVVLVAVLVGVFFLTRGSGSKSFSRHGVAFSYPGGWSELTNLRFQSQVGSAESSEAVGPDTRSFVIVATYRINSSITGANVQQFQPAVVSTIQQVAQGARGSVVTGPQRVTMGGLPGYRFQIRGKDSNGTAIESRIVLVFRGTTEYFLNCQHTTSLSAEVEKGCDQIMSTFRAS